MNAIEKRALYNLLRMNWLNEPTLSVEEWQVEDFRPIPLLNLFKRLSLFDIHLDRVSFVAFADESDSPEDLAEQLIGDREYSAAEEDRLYLVVFELWRRLMSEKPSLSIVCNELDYQIHLYDQGLLDNPFALQDALTHFLQILDENADKGIPSEQVLQLISTWCANDIEAFLYDFIFEQIEVENETYAQELLNDFELYLGKSKWFKLLKFRMSKLARNKMSHKIAEELLEDYLDDGDLEFHFEFLSALSEHPSGKENDIFFPQVADKTIQLINLEDDFQDFLALAITYFHNGDKALEEKTLQAILKHRHTFSSDQTMKKDDPDFITFSQLIRKELPQ